MKHPELKVKVRLVKLGEGTFMVMVDDRPMGISVGVFDEDNDHE